MKSPNYWLTPVATGGILVALLLWFIRVVNAPAAAYGPVRLNDPLAAGKVNFIPSGHSDFDHRVILSKVGSAIYKEVEIGGIQYSDIELKHGTVSCVTRNVLVGDTTDALEILAKPGPRSRTTRKLRVKKDTITAIAEGTVFSCSVDGHPNSSGHALVFAVLSGGIRVTHAQEPGKIYTVTAGNRLRINIQNNSPGNGATIRPINYNWAP